MSDNRQEIKVVGVDKEAIKMISGSQVWIIPFKLSLMPDQDWEKKFFEVQQRGKDTVKRKTKIVGDFITVEIAEMEELQKVLDVIKVDVAATNLSCEGDYQTKLKVRREIEASQQKQIEATKKFQDESDKLKF